MGHILNDTISEDGYPNNFKVFYTTVPDRNYDHELVFNQATCFFNETSKSYDVFHQDNLFTSYDVDMDLSGELTFSANGTNLIYRSNLDDEIKMYYLAGYNQIFVDAV